MQSKFSKTVILIVLKEKVNNTVNRTKDLLLISVLDSTHISGCLCFAHENLH